MENLEKLLNVDIPKENICFLPETVSHKGRAKTIEVPELTNLGQGRLPAPFMIAKNNFAIYRQMLIEQAKVAIEKDIEDEELRIKKMENDLKERYNLQLTVKEKKVVNYHKIISKVGIILLVLTMLFAFSINYINLYKFFGDAMIEKFGIYIAIGVLVFISLLISLSFGFFAALKNKRMVEKTVWILPADLFLAFLIANGVIPEVGWMYTAFQIFAFLLYVIQMWFIVIEITNLFVGKGIEGKESDHYEKIFGSLF